LLDFPENPLPCQEKSEADGGYVSGLPGESSSDAALPQVKLIGQHLRSYTK